MAKDMVTAKHIINLNGRLLDLSKPKIMGILNITPDSFYEGSRFKKDSVLAAAQKMIDEGAHILDVGGYSTRPGAKQVEVEEELNRVVPVIELLANEFDIPLSVDTYRSSVAKQSVELGAAMVNDVSGGNLDSGMFDAIAELQVPYVLMHMRGTPEDMHEKTNYENISLEVIDELQWKVSELNNRGVADIIVDPGFGFAKTMDQNYELLKNLDYFKVLERPVLVGLSRKSMIYKFLETDAASALNGTTALNTFCLLHGASILRVHDVGAASETIELITKVRKSDKY